MSRDGEPVSRGEIGGAHLPGTRGITGRVHREGGMSTKPLGWFPDPFEDKRPTPARKPWWKRLSPRP